jgi:hypothetical protein
MPMTQPKSTQPEKMLGGLPIAGVKEPVQGLLDALKVTPFGGELTGFCAILALTLSVATPRWAQDAPAKSFADMVQVIALVLRGPHDPERLDKVSVAVDFIKRMDLPKAQLAVNEALQLAPRNAHLHSLNGFVYNQQARQGDTRKGRDGAAGLPAGAAHRAGQLDLARALGLACIDLKAFHRARSAFSRLCCGHRIARCRFAG